MSFISLIGLICLIVFQSGIGTAESAGNEEERFLPTFSRLPDSLSETPEAKLTTNFTDRIVGGDVAKSCEFPYQVSLQRGTKHYCGGSIVGEYCVASAAHCARGQNPSKIRIYAGSIELNGTGRYYAVKSITIHPDYDSSTIENDISLFWVEESLIASADGEKCAQSPISLPEVEAKPGTILKVSGWGTTKEGGKVSTTLRHVDVPLTSNEDCIKAYGETEITSSMICAGVPEGGKDSCQGDSGGPLVDTKTNTLTGIVSWGYGCARPDYPGVYTDVKSFTKWIYEQTNNTVQYEQLYR